MEVENSPVEIAMIPSRVDIALTLYNTMIAATGKVQAMSTVKVCVNKAIVL